MPRNTLSWIRCDICGRRAPTVRCMLGGRSVQVCPYCMIAFSSLPVLKCPHASRIRARPERALSVNEGIISEVSRAQAVAERPPSRPSSTTRRRRARRRY